MDVLCAGSGLVESPRRRGYPRPWLRYDLVAGLVLVTLLVPMGGRTPR